MPSATGSASRRYWQAEPAPTGPCEASRANHFLAGRSLAAIFVFFATPERDQREPEVIPTVRAARGAPATRFFRATGHLARPVSSGLVRFDDFEMQWNGGGIFVAAMERNGEAANWRVRAEVRPPIRPRGGSVQTLGAQLKRLVADARVLSQRVWQVERQWRAAKYEPFAGARRAAASHQFTNFSCRTARWDRACLTGDLEPAASRTEGAHNARAVSERQPEWCFRKPMTAAGAGR